MQKLIKLLKSQFQAVGLDITRFPGNQFQKRIILLKKYGIDVILDVGASWGGYAISMRAAGYRNQLISFEPIPQSFVKLAAHFKKDKQWYGYNFALGNINGKHIINISADYESSSILPICEAHILNARNSSIVGTETVAIKRLDTIFNELDIRDKRIFMKIDTQGYECQVLEGAENVLESIIGIQLEMSTEELYKGQILYEEMMHYLLRKGFSLCSIEPGFSSKIDGRLLQFDGIFFKTDRLYRIG